MSETQLMLRSERGVIRHINAKIAETAKQRAAGFQHICPDLVRQWAILFVFQSTQRSTFHMENVKASLEIAYISKEGRILEIQQMPLEQGLASSGIYQADRAYQYALEAIAGRLSELGLTSEDWWLVLESTSI